MTFLQLMVLSQWLSIMFLFVIAWGLRNRVEALEAAADHRAAVEYFSAPPGPYKSAIRSPDSIRKAEDADRRRR